MLGAPVPFRPTPMTVHTFDSLDELPTAPAALGAAYPVPPRVERGAKRILVLDDEDGVRAALSRFLRGRGYEVEGAASVGEALASIRRTRFALVLCDVCLPDVSGLELVPAARAIDPDLAVLMVSGVNDAPTAAAAMASGAVGYLLKPVPLDDLLVAVQRALHRRDLDVERRRFEQMIREEVATATAEVERDRAALRTLMVSVAETLINAMEVKDVFLRGHSQRVASLGAELAE